MCPRSSERKHASEQLASDNTVRTLTAAKYKATADSGLDRGRRSQSAQIQVQGNDIYYTQDGTTPSAAAGKIGYVGSLICLSGADAIAAFKYTRVSADGEIDVDYYR